MAALPVSDAAAVTPAMLVETSDVPAEAWCTLRAISWVTRVDLASRTARAEFRGLTRRRAQNYCESYHLPWVHPALNSYSRLEDHCNIAEPRVFSGQGSEVYSPQLDADGRRFPSFPGLSGRWNHAAEYVALYPNVLLGVHKDHFFAMLIEPRAVDHTVERLEIYYADSTVAGADGAGMRATCMEMWRQLFLEDVFVVEGMQKGRARIRRRPASRP